MRLFITAAWSCPTWGAEIDSELPTWKDVPGRRASPASSLSSVICVSLSGCCLPAQLLQEKWGLDAQKLLSDGLGWMLGERSRSLKCCRRDPRLWGWSSSDANRMVALFKNTSFSPRILIPGVCDVPWGAGGPAAETSSGLLGHGTAERGLGSPTSISRCSWLGGRTQWGFPRLWGSLAPANPYRELWLSQHSCKHRASGRGR